MTSPVDLNEESLAWAISEIRRFSEIAKARLTLPARLKLSDEPVTCLPDSLPDSHDKWRKENV